jgi:DNA-directed RNA polymerase subunit alpha
VLKASDLKMSDHLTIVNPAHEIANVSVGGELDIQFFVESGRGYQPAQWPLGKGIQEDDRIYLDAMFSPVSKIFFDVEKTMVGKDIDYDKLTVKIFTNGAETPTDALNYAVSVLRSQLEHFLVSTEISFNEFSKVVVEEPVSSKEETSGLGLDSRTVEILLKPIDELELSARAHNCLISAGKKRILDLVNLSREEALNLKNFGSKSLNEVEESLHSLGLSFGADIKEADIKKILKSKSEED